MGVELIRPIRRSVVFGNVSGTKTERKNDCYQTSPEAIAALIDAETPAGPQWEPFIGPDDRVGLPSAIEATTLSRPAS
jgi:hypothetical protein